MRIPLGPRYILYGCMDPLGSITSSLLTGGWYGKGKRISMVVLVESPFVFIVPKTYSPP